MNFTHLASHFLDHRWERCILQCQLKYTCARCFTHFRLCSRDKSSHSLVCIGEWCCLYFAWMIECPNKRKEWSVSLSVWLKAQLQYEQVALRTSCPESWSSRTYKKEVRSFIYTYIRAPTCSSATSGWLSMVGIVVNNRKDATERLLQLRGTRRK
jgi:hypothetical protein